MGNLSFGTYEVVISFIGYKTDTLGNVSVSREAPVVDLGTIALAVSLTIPELFAGYSLTTDRSNQSHHS